MAVLQGLCAPSSVYSAQPPLCVEVLRQRMLAKDEGAAAAWAMAEKRLTEMAEEGKTAQLGAHEGGGAQRVDGGARDDSKEGDGEGRVDGSRVLSAAAAPSMAEQGREQVEGGSEADDVGTSAAPVERVYCVEVCLYLDVLFGVWLLDGDYYDESAALFAGLVAQLSSLNRRSVDLFSAKIFYYYALSHEKWEDAERTAGDATAPASAPASASASAPSSLPSPPSSSPPLLSSLLPVLLSSYRTACLQHNEPGQAVLINCILRIHLLQHDYALADTFRLKSSYPRDLRLISSAVYARYSYYVGKILCIQLAYSDAFNSLQQARRKAPQHKAQAADFKYHINLLAILTQLLMGEIPERTTFNDNTSQQQQLATITALTRANSINLSRPHPAPPLALSTTTATTSTTPSAPSSLPSTSSPPSPSSSASAPSPSSSLSLYPYLCLTRAVRVGDLSTFHSVTSKYAQLFARDDVSSLILRLRHNVIKAGLRKINVAYSAIPMAGISQKLSLESTFSADGESLVVKAISDGVIDATLDPRTSALHSKPLTPSYASSQPQAAFHRRIAFALDIHSEAVKALTYPATHSRAALHDAYEDDDDDEDSLAALQRKEKKDKDKQQGGGAEDKDKKEAQDKSKDKH